ncbi:MAG: hypothetical protein WCJ51_02715 [Candidatus Moraniibacteriota bacterium]
MQKIDYREILTSAFWSTWRNKFLWLFGFFVFLGSLLENLSINQNILSKNDTPLLLFDATEKQSLLFPIILFIFFTYTLRNLSTASIIRGLRNPALYKQKKALEIIKEMFHYFGRLVWLDFFLGTGLLVVFFLLSLPVTSLFSLKATTFAISSLTLASLIFASLLFLAFFLRKYSYLFIILGDLNFKNALEFSYDLFKKNTKASLLMLAIATFALICAIGILFLLLALLFLIILPIIINTHSPILSGVTLFLIMLGLILITFGLSLFNVFLQAVWLDFFSQISMEKISEEKLTPIAIVEDEVSIPETV